MIVIGTHNGQEHILKCLTSLENVKNQLSVSIVDSGSNEEYISYLKGLEKSNPFSFDIKVFLIKDNVYETGIIQYVSKNIEADTYYFIQDSIEIKHNLFFERAKEKLSIVDVVPIITFWPDHYDDDEQVFYLYEKFGTPKYSQGIFGNMFIIKRENLLKIPASEIPEPKGKFGSCAMERGWAILFEKYGLTISPIEGHYHYWRLYYDDYILFKKNFGNRAD